MDDRHWRTDTAERPAVAGPPRQTAPAATGVGPPPVDRRQPPRDPLPGWVAWVVVAVTLVLAAVVGTQLLLQSPDATTAVDGGDGSQTANDDPGAQPSGEAGAEEGEEKGGSTAAPTEEPVAEPTESAAPPPESVDVTSLAQVSVPGAAPPNNDVTGELVTFVGPNLIDGDPTTTWRVAGDASGSTLTFSFAKPVTITSVGVLNGYAKVSTDDSGREFNWYAANRRLRVVEWVLGDTVVPIEYGDVPEIQQVPIEPTPTSMVQLRIVAVSPPGLGPTGRDYTAISEVAFQGYES